MTNTKLILFLDLDGVLITSPPWRPGEIDKDGYSTFNKICIENLNKLLDEGYFEIYLTSARRRTKAKDEMNKIFKTRGVGSKIKDYIPISEKRISRKQEIEDFINENEVRRFLIIDDDKSLNTFEPKTNLIQTDYLKGFTSDKLEEAIQKVKSINAI